MIKSLVYFSLLFTTVNYAVFKGVAGAQNLLQAWVLVIFGVGVLQMLFFTAPHKEQPLRNKVHTYTHRTLTAAFIGVLVWYGWFWCAAAYMYAWVVFSAKRAYAESKVTANGKA
jgi:cytochrome c biogenesis protein CcdA